MAKKRIRFNYETATLEELRERRQFLFESNKKLFGKTARERYIEVIERFNLPNTLGLRISDPKLERAELRKQISIMTGGYEYHRSAVARENLAEMVRKLSFKVDSVRGKDIYRHQGLIDFIKTLSLQDIMRHSEEYDYIFRVLGGYGEASEEGSSNEDIINDIADSLRDEVWKSPKLTEEYRFYLESLGGDRSEALSFEDYVWQLWGLK